MIQTTIRLPCEVPERADALIPHLRKNPIIAATGRSVSRSTVIQIAIQRGLEILEAEARKGKEDVSVRRGQPGKSRKR